MIYFLHRPSGIKKGEDLQFVLVLDESRIFWLLVTQKRQFQVFTLGRVERSEFSPCFPQAAVLH